jgi:hypothetical protein
MLGLEDNIFFGGTNINMKGGSINQVKTKIKIKLKKYY